MGERGKIPYILISIQYLMEAACSFMLLFLYLQQNSNSEPKMVVAPTDSVDMVQKTSNQYH
jgi:hypothetical protein